ncbi:3-hydroxyacyl-CoA dehydrogenase NAD-binding domain-containing protein [Comamonas sp.]|uniref:3-hydroxyacyl-CoA dehydrogenase NAD-binding domain-containing protein n=1 Tax=Comamonas sp. TaxID=34028 RepID=UPI0025BCD66D|nr:3-hydroxyacyl-CoA dehydrogenase NAD-binding domain-containing protein [Comamonas sp.]
MTHVNHLTVLGSGVLGGQIAWHSAFKGKAVAVYDISEEALERCRAAQAQYAAIYLTELGASGAGIETGMVPIPIAVEHNGYVINTWFPALLKAAQTLVTNGIATPEDVDRTFLIANCGARMGPYRNAGGQGLLRLPESGLCGGGLSGGAGAVATGRHRRPLYFKSLSLWCTYGAPMAHLWRTYGACGPASAPVPVPSAWCLVLQ